MIIEKDSVSIDYVNLYSLITKNLGIPIFQRFYDWKKDQTKQLLEDLVSVSKDKTKDLYLLDFIYYLESDKFMIADGQQRLVTINILQKAINDHITEKDLPIQKLQFFNIEYDISHFQKKYLENFHNYPTAPFKKIYLHFKDWIANNNKILSDLVDVLKNNIRIYLKKCSNADDAFVIFQEINTGGKPLSKEEIIQTAINQYSKLYSVPITFEVKDIKLALISYYKFITGDTSQSFDNILIISFLKNNVTKDRNSFKKFVETLKTLVAIDSNPVTSIIQWINRTSIFDVLNVLAMKGIDLNSKREYLEKIILPLCFLSIELSLTGGLPSLLKYLMNLVIQMIREEAKVSEIEMTIAKYINDNESSCTMDFSQFLDAIGGSGNATTGIKKALLLIDIILSNTSGLINVNKINLEHIYPQNPSVDWASRGWPTTREDQKVIINNIGNQFLLSENVNKSISNKYISEKILAYNKIIAKDALLRTKLNSVDFASLESNKVDYIKFRQKEIAEYVFNNFPFAKVILKNYKNI
jgi:uncharacterized protein with ParB-like and HNH nuclease domain